MISITGLDKADVLAALYNASRPQGMGFMHYDPKPMTRDEAATLLAETTYFDYLKGRVMKLNLSKPDSFDEWGYDRDNGPGAAERALSSLRASGNVASPEIALAHSVGVVESAVRVELAMGERSGWAPGDRDTPAAFNLGLADVADELAPKVAKAVDSQLPK